MLSDEVPEMWLADDSEAIISTSEEPWFRKFNLAPSEVSKGGEKEMKIAVASSGKTLEDQVNPRFGRCPYFLIVDSETGEFEAIENSAAQAFRGAGISAAQMVANKGAKVVIAGNFGPNALNVLQAGGIKVFGIEAGVSVKEAVERYKADRLEEAQVSTMGFGRGFGGGRRGGRW